MISAHTPRTSRLRFALAAGFLATALVASGATSATAAAQDGDTVYIGGKQGYGGTGVFPIYASTPADPENPGEPELWAYCIEHDVSAETDIEGTIGDLSTYLGANYFIDPAVQSKVQWVLAHSYPALSLEDFGTAVGVPGIQRDDAIEAIQYAIWRYTELTFDAAWNFENADSEAAYYYLLAGANASTGTVTADLSTVAISAPSAAQVAGKLVGPFVVTTNQPTATVTVDPGVTVTDASGAAIDTTAVVDGQSLYLDLRGTKTAGSATLKATVSGSSVNGFVVSVPTTPGATPTVLEHAQSFILVASGTATTDAQAGVQWTGVAALAATGTPPMFGLAGVAGLALLAGVALTVIRRRAAQH